jgi:hypothetical protein
MHDMPTRHALLFFFFFLFLIFFRQTSFFPFFSFCHDLTDGNGEAYKAGD